MYAVAKGRCPGIYGTWKECEAQVKGFSGAKYKKFTTRREAEEFIRPEPVAAVNVSPTPAPPVVQEPIGGPIFELEAELPIIAYTDGSSQHPPQGTRGGSGAVILDGDYRTEIYGRIPVPPETNQRGELYAVYMVLERVPLDVPLEIRTDSQYVINTLTVWAKNWDKKNEWGRIQNADISRPLWEGVKSRTAGTKFTYVPAHTGIPENERADQLAKQGCWEESLEVKQVE